MRTPPHSIRVEKSIHPSILTIKGKALQPWGHIRIPWGSPTPTSIKSESLGVVPRYQQVLKLPMAASKASLQLCFFGLLLFLIILFNGSGQSLIPGEEQKAGKNWLLLVI